MHTCPIGSIGSFCKHQLAVKEKFNVFFKPTLPTLDTADKQLYYYISTGKTNVPSGFYSLNEIKELEN